ncbi:MAG: phosphopantothenoylcysteine decarboxylase [Phycisphaerales bacterium]|nr:phosphopantothenoylcysteine decarboxylase [Phycisphaerales bacterium]
MSERAARVLITAGPTHEPVDAVRYLANRSSGAMGVALAEAAVRRDADVTLLLGPCAAVVPAGCRAVSFESTADLERLLDEHFQGCDVLIMAAAVADYRPVRTNPGKLPRRPERLVVELEPTPDLLARCAAARRPGQFIVGFALEPEEALEQKAREKLVRKGVDAIVANPLETMGASTIRARVVTAGGEVAVGDVPRRTKAEFAAELMDWVMNAWRAARSRRG